MAFFETITSKIQTAEQLSERLSAWRRAGERVVFTNGCFDLLHYGHLHYLADARDQGDRLVVGLNSDASVRRLKGPHRPINDQASRAHQIAALEMVDAVVVFETDTPLELIHKLAPDVLVKGGDWKPADIVGSDFVLAKGGQVLSLPFVPGYSTTSLETKIRQGGA